MYFQRINLQFVPTYCFSQFGEYLSQSSTLKLHKLHKYREEKKSKCYVFQFCSNFPLVYIFSKERNIKSVTLNKIWINFQSNTLQNRTKENEIKMKSSFLFTTLINSKSFLNEIKWKRNISMKLH